MSPRRVLAVAAFTFGLASARAQTPTPPAIDAAASGGVFDSTTHITIKATDAATVQFTDTMTVDLHFLAAFDDKEGFADEPADPGAGRCLLSCGEDDRSVRYGVYLSGTLDSVTFYNGRDAAVFDYQFQKGVWYHLAVVVQNRKTAVLVDGEPIGVEDIGLGAVKQACPLFLGASRRDGENFFGYIRAVRFWQAALSWAEINMLRDQAGPPADPMLANRLVAYTRVTPERTDLVTTSMPSNPVRAWQGKVHRLHAPFARAIAWQHDLAAAWDLADKEKKLLLVYTTRGDARDPVCDALENGPLVSDWFRAAANTFVPHLDVATGDAGLSALGLPAGSCALMSTAGILLRVFQPWSEDRLGELVANAALFVEPWSTGTSLDDRIGFLMYEASRRDLPADGVAMLEALRQEIAGPDASPVAKSRLLVAEAEIQQRRHLAAIADLQARYWKAQEQAVRNGRIVESGRPSWGDEVRNLQEEALELWATAPLPIEPNPALATFAVLCWKQAVEFGGPELREEVFEFVGPVAAMVPMAGLEVRSLIPLETK